MQVVVEVAQDLNLLIVHQVELVVQAVAEMVKVEYHNQLVLVQEQIILVVVEVELKTLQVLVEMEDLV